MRSKIAVSTLICGGAIFEAHDNVIPACENTLSIMAKSGPSRLRPLKFWFMPITRSPAQKPACKDLKRNGQSPAITLKAAYTPVSNRAGSRSLS